MKRTKKIVVGFLACLSVLSGTLGLAACGNDSSLNKNATEGLHYQKIAGKDEYRVIGLGMAEETDIVISSTYKGLPVTEIGDMAFYMLDGAMSLTSITIPDGVRSIGGLAFYGCSSLKSIEIPDSVKSIGENAFYNCKNLIYNKKNNLKYLGNEQNPYLYLAGVSDTSITSAAIENTCKWIGDYAFSGCDSLTGVFISDSVKSIGDYAFQSCNSLTSVFISDSVKSIGDYTFAYCDSLTNIEIPNSVKSIGYEAFYSCDSLTSIKIPDSVTSIDERAFSYCKSLTSVVIGDGVTIISDYAFAWCESLTSVEIPDSVTSIGNSAFYSCESLTSITFNGTKKEWNAIGKVESWKNRVPATKVVCSDGEVEIGDKRA